MQERLEKESVPGVITVYNDITERIRIELDSSVSVDTIINLLETREFDPKVELALIDIILTIIIYTYKPLIVLEKVNKIFKLKVVQEYAKISYDYRDDARYVIFRLLTTINGYNEHIHETIDLVIDHYKKTKNSIITMLLIIYITYNIDKIEKSNIMTYVIKLSRIINDDLIDDFVNCGYRYSLISSNNLIVSKPSIIIGRYIESILITKNNDLIHSILGMLSRLNYINIRDIMVYVNQALLLETRVYSMKDKDGIGKPISQHIKYITYIKRWC